MATIAALCDADVLVPILCCDFILTAAEAGLVDIVVSDLVLREVETNLVEQFSSIDPDRLLRRVEDMRDFLRDHIISYGDDSAAATMGAINVKDRHVVGSALSASVDLLVTNDRRLRTEVERAGIAVTAVSSDDFARMLWASGPSEETSVLEVLLAKRRRQPHTREEFAAQLSRHFPAVAQAWLETP